MVFCYYATIYTKVLLMNFLNTSPMRVTVGPGNILAGTLYGVVSGEGAKIMNA